jgi:site-specific recombinase XerD
MYGCLSCFQCRRHRCRSARPACRDLRLLGRHRGETRLHTESDLRVFLRWCTDQDLNPLAAPRIDIERYVRWLQDVRRYQPSTVSRRLSVVVGFYRVCVIDQILPHFVTTMLDAGVSLRDVQIAARHADPRTTMRYDRARENLDRHPNYILAAYMASGT